MAPMPAETVGLSPDACHRAVRARDARFDGWFVVGVPAAGVYCRPSCPARRLKLAIYHTAAGAQAHGLRACGRCLPDAAPGSPEWALRTDLAARAMRLIGDGVVQRDGVAGLARRLGCSESGLTAVLSTELGAGPLELARAHRTHTARLLIESTGLGLADVAFAAGFAGERELDEGLLAVYGVRSGALRAAAGSAAGLTAGSAAGSAAGSVAGSTAGGGPAGSLPGTVALRLPLRAPMDGTGLLSFLVKRAVPGVESGGDGRYGRALALPHAAATVWLSVGESTVDVVLRLGDLRDLGAAVSRVRRLMDADADPAGIDGVLAADPTLAPSVLATPGVRVPGAVDGAELVLRAVLGQQVSVAAARTAAGRLATALGAALPKTLTIGLATDDQLDVVRPTTLPATDGGLLRLFPSAAAVAERGAEVLTGPRQRVGTILAVAAALASGELQVHPGRDPAELSRDLQALPGIGPWTAGYVAMRVLGATDLLLATDLMVRRGAEALGLPCTVRGLDAYSPRWSPYRSYAGIHLWRNAT
jgi:AraC family transcriptional regulator, regulatory protein of adaptative response / DNA-3-methyladenine glycosylase II